jgi:hypothetical protein
MTTIAQRLLIAAVVLALAAAIVPRVAGGGTPVRGLAAVDLAPAQIGSGLYPGSRVTVTSLVRNRSDQPVRIRSVRLDGWVASRPRCHVPVLRFRPQTNEGRGWIVPAAGALRLRFPRAVSMGLLAEERCQGARFALRLVAG